MDLNDHDGDWPGYRRRLVVVPGADRVTAMLEDDMHCMTVALRIDGQTVIGVEAATDRAPWTTCPNARSKLVETFCGVAVSEVTARRDKQQNCTHLHDLAVLAASHCADPAPTVWDIHVSDPRGGVRLLEIERNGAAIHRWTERDGILVSPDAIAGLTLLTLRDWIASLSGAGQEAARMLQWGGLVAHGRTIPLAMQSDATALPPSCYTFQPARAEHARRVGKSRDFSSERETPLPGWSASAD